MRTIGAIVLLFLLTGCASRPGSVVLWNPFTWGSRIAPASVDRNQEKRDDAQAGVQVATDATAHAANVEVGKALGMLQQAPPSRQVDFAKRFVQNAHNLLNQFTPLTFEELNSNNALVTALLSENQRVREAAEKDVERAEKRNEKVAADLADARAKLEKRQAALDAANANLREAYDRENALANQVRNFWFIAGLLAFLWLGGNVLAAVARVYPPLAPVSRAINGIAAPALAFAEARATEGLRRIGQGMKTIREKLPAVAEQVTSIFDDETDADHKQVIGGAAGNTSP